MCIVEEQLYLYGGFLVDIAIGQKNPAELLLPGDSHQ